MDKSLINSSNHQIVQVKSKDQTECQKLEPVLDQKKQIQKNFDYFKINPFASKQKLSQVKPQTFRLLDSEKWDFTVQYEADSASDLLQLISESRCKLVNTENICHQRLLNSLLLPKLSKLLILSINKCEMLSIEPFAYLDSPSLHLIELQENRISVVKSIGKWKFEYLNVISFQNNYVQEVKQASRMRLTTFNSHMAKSINRKSQVRGLEPWDVDLQCLDENRYSFNTKINSGQSIRRGQNATNYIYDYLYIEDINFFAKVESHVEIYHRLRLDTTGKLRQACIKATKVQTGKKSGQNTTKSTQSQQQQAINKPRKLTDNEKLKLLRKVNFCIGYYINQYNMNWFFKYDQSEQSENSNEENEGSEEESSEEDFTIIQKRKVFTNIQQSKKCSSLLRKWYFL